ncbi:MAG: hypothetical protein QF786_12165, partial [Vicinamibacterales bacterium]|nr:hypothetical protein [Vicinamibacterales bacterium]
HVYVVKEDPPGAGPIEGAQNVEKRALARPRRPLDGDHLPAIDLKIGENLADLADIDLESGSGSLVVGVGVELTRFIIEARGTWSLRNIAKDAAGADVKSKTFAVLFGLRFN